MRCFGRRTLAAPAAGVLCFSRSRVSLVIPVTPENTLPAVEVSDRLAEAARYAVLGRLLPVLLHDVAGSMQPVLMRLVLLERRVQKPQADLDAITKGVISLSALTKQAAADCIAALGWISSNDDPQVGLRSAVDEAGQWLVMELAVNPLALVNSVADDSTTVPRSFMRSVLMGAMLAFCDQHAVSGFLEVTLEPAGRLHLRLRPGDAGQLPESFDVVQKTRLIDWPDVQAMATACGIEMAQGDGWLTLDLPGC